MLVGYYYKSCLEGLRVVEKEGVWRMVEGGGGRMGREGEQSEHVCTL